MKLTPNSLWEKAFSRRDELLRGKMSLEFKKWVVNIPCYTINAQLVMIREDGSSQETILIIQMKSRDQRRITYVSSNGRTQVTTSSLWHWAGWKVKPHQRQCTEQKRIILLTWSQLLGRPHKKNGKILHTGWPLLTVRGTRHVKCYSYHARPSVTVSGGGRNATVHDPKP